MLSKIREWGVKPRIVTGDIAILNDSTRYQAEPGNAYPEALPRL